jgi:glycosyltransferase involved in cell wall biosynthesis
MNLINLGFNPWSNFWKRNQTIAYMLSEKEIFRAALFLHSPVWLMNLFQNTIQEFSQPQINKWVTIFPKKVSPKITAFTPVYFPYRNKLKLIKIIDNAFNNLAIQKFIDPPFVLIINDPQADQEIVNKLIEKSKFTIFDWSDDFAEFSENDFQKDICSNTCKKYCESADLVITINDDLRGRAEKYNKNSFTIKNATNFFTFESNPKIVKKTNRIIRRIGPLVVGYIGWLNSMRLDLDLIEYVASERPDINFVFMGPKSEEKPLGNIIPKMSNIHILPPVPYSEYPACLSALDICILPNKISPHTDGNDPIKIYDYLATGKPIVTTPTAGTEDFKDYLHIAKNKIEFLVCIDKALRESSATLSIKRQNTAKEHSWQKRINEIDRIIMPFLKS